MGTRAIIHIEEDGETLTSIYRHYDGYPEGLGEELKEIIINAEEGFGIACLAAQIIAKLKTCKGNVYMATPNTSDIGEEYTYYISGAKGEVELKCVSRYGTGGFVKQLKVGSAAIKPGMFDLG